MTAGRCDMTLPHTMAFAEIFRTLAAEKGHFIDYLSEFGAMDQCRLHEGPFTDIDDQGVSRLFPQAINPSRELCRMFRRRKSN